MKKIILLILSFLLQVGYLVAGWQGSWKLYEITPGAVEHPATYWLNIASWRGDVDKVRQYLIEGGDPNSYLQNFRAGPSSNALWMAVANGHAQAVRLLLANGADPNKSDTFRMERGKDEMIKSMWGGPFPAQNLRDRSLTVLMVAAIAGFKSIVELLLDSGANASTLAADVAATPEIANLIRQYMTRAKRPTHTLKGQPVAIPPSTIPGEPERGEYITRPGELKFWYAAYYGDIEHLKKYLKSAKNINEKVYWSARAKPALIAAIENKKPEAVRLLLQYGADPNMPDSEGMVPIMQAAYSKMRLEVFDWLLDSGANPNAQSAGGTQLMWIIADQVKDMVQDYINGTRQPTYSLMQVNLLESLGNQLQKLQNQLSDLSSKLARVA